MNWRTQREDEDIEGPCWPQKKGSGETLRKLLHISGVTIILVKNSLMGHCPNSSYIPWFWSNYIISLKRHHTTRPTFYTKKYRSR